MLGVRRFGIATFGNLPTLPRTAVRGRPALTAGDHDVTDDSAFFAAHGVRRTYPPALRYPEARLQATIAALKKLGMDPTKALRRWPKLWSVDPECWEERLVVLRELDLGVGKIVAMCPSILSLSPRTLRVKTESLSKMGLNVSKVVSFCPHALTLSEDHICRTLAFLDGVGLDGVRVVNSVPAVLCYSVDIKLRPIFHFFTVRMARSVIEVSKFPACFCYSLNGRLIPRHDFAVLHHKQHLSLPMLFSTPDVRFLKAMGQTPASYHTFLTRDLRE